MRSPTVAAVGFLVTLEHVSPPALPAPLPAPRGRGPRRCASWRIGGRTVGLWLRSTSCASTRKTFCRWDARGLKTVACPSSPPCAHHTRFCPCFGLDTCQDTCHSAHLVAHRLQLASACISRLPGNAKTFLPIAWSVKSGSSFTQARSLWSVGYKTGGNVTDSPFAVRVTPVSVSNSRHNSANQRNSYPASTVTV